MDLDLVIMAAESHPARSRSPADANLPTEALELNAGLHEVPLQEALGVMKQLRGGLLPLWGPPAERLLVDPELDARWPQAPLLTQLVIQDQALVMHADLSDRDKVGHQTCP